MTGAYLQPETGCNPGTQNGNTDKDVFDAKLEFDIKIISYTGDDSWVEKTVKEAIKCLKSDKLPDSGEDCDFCKYRKAVKQYE